MHVHNASMDERGSHQNEMQHHYGPREKFTPSLVICSLMILIPAIACLAAVAAAALFDRIVVVSQPSWPQYSVNVARYLR